MSNLDIIREKLDGGQFTDLEELASGLLAALESIQRLCEAGKSNLYYKEKPQMLPTVRVEVLERQLSYWTDEFAAPVKTCAYETYAATLETPAEGCEEDAVESSEYCKEHGE